MAVMIWGSEVVVLFLVRAVAGWLPRIFVCETNERRLRFAKKYCTQDKTIDYTSISNSNQYITL